MNILIFRNFSRFFLNFYEFNIDLFELNLLKNYIFYCVLMWQLMWCKRKKWRHVATYQTATCHTCVFMRACVHARVFTHVCARACVGM